MYNNPYQSYPYLSNYGVPSYRQPQFQAQNPQAMAQAQPNQMQAQQGVQYDTPIQLILYGTIKEAEGQIVYPNTKVLFIDKVNGMSYLKTANNEGLSSIRYFKQTEVNADGTPLKAETPQPQINADDFLKKDALQNYITVDKYNELLGKIETLQRQFLGGRPNAPKQQPNP